DPVDFVRQGALIALTMILIQQTEASSPSLALTRTTFAKIMAEKHEDSMAGPELGFWYWYPWANCASLAFDRTGIISLSRSLGTPAFNFISNAKPSLLAYPSPTKPPTIGDILKVETAIDETDQNAKPAEDGVPAASKPKKQRGPSLETLSRSVSCPLPFNYPTLVSSPSTRRFQKKGAVQRSVGAGGILMLLDKAPEEPTEWIEPSTGVSRNIPVAQEGPVAAVAEADPPPFFEYPFG
ncbi:proteasome regulatory particle base subunit, partial [Tulasnella sp. 427]